MTGGELMARKIEVVDYRPEWETMFKEESKKIKKILGKNCVGVYHIGSTSVKGLPAKPIIDIMPVVKDISLVDAHNSEFEALGYECRGEFGIPGRRFFAKGGDNRRITSIYSNRAIRLISSVTSPYGLPERSFRYGRRICSSEEETGG